MHSPNWCWFGLRNSLGILHPDNLILCLINKTYRRKNPITIGKKTHKTLSTVGKWNAKKHGKVQKKDIENIKGERKKYWKKYSYFQRFSSFPPENGFFPCAGSYTSSSPWPFLLTFTSFQVNFPVEHISFLHPAPLFTPIPFSPQFLCCPAWLFLCVVRLEEVYHIKC